MASQVKSCNSSKEIQVWPVPEKHEAVQKITFSKGINVLYQHRAELNIFFRSEELLRKFFSIEMPKGGASFLRDWNEHEYQIIFIEDAYKKLDEAMSIVAKEFGIALPKEIK